MPRRPVLSTVALALALGTLVACGAEPEAPPTPGVVAVPGAAATVTIPGTWTHNVQSTGDQEELVARRKAATGDPAFQATVVVTGVPATRGLDEEGLAALSAVDALPDWDPTPQSSGAVEVAGLAGFRLVGTYSASGVTVVQQETIVEIGEGEDRVFVYLTSSVAPVGGTATEEETTRQAESVAEAQAIVESVTVTP